MKDLVHRLLHISQKYTKTDMRYLATGSFWLSANQGVSMGLTFILAVALANILPEEVFGSYRFVLSLAAVVGSFSLTGLNLAIIRGVAKGVHGLLRIGFITQLKWSVGTFAASLMLCGYYFLNSHAELALSALIIGILLPIISSAGIYTSYLEGRKNYKQLGIFSIITTIVYTSFLFVTIHLTTYLPAIIFCYFATQAACTYFFYMLAVRSDNKPGENVSQQETVVFGKHLSFLNVLSTLAGQLDKILVFHYLGAAQLAVYALSQIPVGQVRTILKQVAQLAFPKYSSKTVEEIRKSIYQKMFIFTIPIVLMVGAYILLAPYVFKVFFPKYVEAVVYSQVAILSLLFYQKKLITYSVLAHATKKQIYGMSISSSIFKIALLLVLLPLYGIWGAIYTELIAQVVGFALSFRILRKL